MKKLLLSALVALTSLFAAPVTLAATVSGNFNVTVTLTSKCTMASVGDLAFGTYTAFQAGAQNATPVTATLTCTRGMAAGGITANFDTTAGIGATGATAAANAVGAGVIAGLQYDITATPGTVVAGTEATASTIGTADSRPYSITGTMPPGQAGTCTGSSCSATQVRTLTITY